MAKTIDYFKRYPRFVNFLKIVHYHLDKQDYDFPLIIVGATGNGKSMLALHIYELWMKLFQKKELDIKDISVNRFEWIKNFKHLSKADCNIFDEGVTGLYSKESMNKFARTLEKLYQVFRKKNFFTIILIPDFFMITKFFRDHRARGLIWVDKRGQFKYYSKQLITRINAHNENRIHKTLNCVRPTFTGSFPDYTGELRQGYDEMAQNSVDTIIKEVEQELDPKKSPDKYNQMIVDNVNKGKSHKEVADFAGISRQRVGQIVASINKK